MRRALLTAAAVLVAALVLVAAAGGDDGSGGSYEVRAIFDNGSFVTQGEDVRISGANVGSVKSVDISMPDEIVSLTGGPHAVPGKAVVVMEITDSDFQDFRADASCLIRPQSLIGERYIDCRPTRTHPPGTEPAPPLRPVPDGQPGEGQLLLPLENNGKTVDLDLIQNIQRLPYAERFRLILNDLGAGLAARGSDLNRIVRKADPALRETDRLLKIVAAQNHELARLAVDGDRILQPLARERSHVSGFIASSAETAAATAERRADLEENLQKLPATLRELRLTLGSLGAFSDVARPVFGTLGHAAPALTRVTEELPPFAAATTTSLRSLGDAAEASGPDLRKADYIVRKVRGLAYSGRRPLTNLAQLTGSLRKQGGFESLMRFIYNSAGSVNGFDKFGHYLRINILVSSCIEYQIRPLSGCVSNFTGPGTAHPRNAFTREAIARVFRRRTADGGVTAPEAGPARRPSLSGRLLDSLTGGEPPAAGSLRGSDPGVLDYLLGP